MKQCDLFVCSEWQVCSDLQIQRELEGLVREEDQLEVMENYPKETGERRRILAKITWQKSYWWQASVIKLSPAEFLLKLENTDEHGSSTVKVQLKRTNGISRVLAINSIVWGLPSLIKVLCDLWAECQEFMLSIPFPMFCGLILTYYICILLCLKTDLFYNWHIFTYFSEQHLSQRFGSFW